MKIVITNTNIQDLKKGKRPIFWGLSETALRLKRNPFFIPEENDQFTAQLYWVVRINRLGKNIAKRFAYRYYNDVTIGTIFCNNSLRDHLQNSGHPTYEAYAFDGAGTVGEFLTKSQLEEIGALTVNGKICEKEIKDIYPKDVQDMVDNIIYWASRGSTIRQGDLLFIELSEKEFPLILDSNVRLNINGMKVLDVNIK